MVIRVFLALSICVACCAPVHATVKPGMRQMVAASQVILLAKLHALDPPDAEQQRVTLKVTKYLYGNIFTMPTEITFTYRLRDRSRGSFDRLHSEGAIAMFFLKYMPNSTSEFKDFHLELSDAWFGVETDPKLINEAEVIIQDINKLLIPS